MVTYNHEKYIAQAVESVLMQETDFDVELVIGEDCSTDRTREILLDLQAKHPDQVKLLPSERNLGVNGNIARTLQACTGQYIAFLDGDDYWISPHKLQLQVDYLDRHPEITVCYHKAHIVNEDGSVVLGEGAKPDSKPVSTIEDIIRRNFIVSCTVMYRHGFVSAFPEWWYEIVNADWTLHIFHAQHGDIGFIPEVLSAYRYNPAGIWTRLPYEDRLVTRIKAYSMMNQNLEYRYDGIFQLVLSDLWKRLSDVSIENSFRAGQEDPSIHNISTIIENGFQALPYPPGWKAELLTEVYQRLLFDHYQNQNLSKVRYCCGELLLLRPSLFRDKGILKVCLIAFLGSIGVSQRSTSKRPR